MVAAELSAVYHAVKHHHSYNSTDCGVKLNPVIFPDSGVAKKMACGRTKAEALVTNVLAPKSVELIINDLTSKKPMKPTNFSISTDASNMKNRKMFPVCLQYFTVESGINKKLLEFVEQNDEKSSEIADMLISSIQDNGLDIQNISAYSADNASVNYGCKKSVFKELHSLNSNIVKANCNAHVVHNTLRKLTDVLDCDVETTITSIYGHFSVSANRRTDLQEFFEFVDLEYHDLLRHVTTRWLSLGPAIKRLLESWPAILSYFRSMGSECPKRIAKCLGLPADNEEDDGGIKVNVAKAYLCFILNLCRVFEQTILTLENDTVTVCDVFPAMAALRNKLKDRLSDRHFGFETSVILESEEMPKNITQKIESNFCNALQRAVSYLEQWYDFSDKNIAQMLQKLSLNDMPTFQHLKNACTALKLTVRTIDIDALYDEFSANKDTLRRIVECHKTVAHKWQDFFKSVTDASNLFQLVSFVLSVPASNAFPERTFSVMNSKWRSDRNRLSVSTVAAELQVFTNYDVDCRDFYSLVICDQRLLDAAASNSKYTWKKRVATAGAGAHVAAIKQ